MPYMLTVKAENPVISSALPDPFVSFGDPGTLLTGKPVKISIGKVME